MKDLKRHECERIREFCKSQGDKVTIQETSGQLKRFLPEYAWDGTHTIQAGTLFLFGNEPYLALNTIFDQPQFAPDKAGTESLYDHVEFQSYKGEPARVFPTQFFGTSNAYRLDELAWYNGHYYRCKQDYCVYSPDVTPQLWEQVDIEEE